MSVAVLNTTSGISAKTLVIAESPATITGLLSFSRGASAPFAVNSGAAVVPNLDADKLDGIEAAAFLLLAGGTMVGDLKFGDALYDIGKSAATRPRDGFFSRALVVGTTVTAAAFLQSTIALTDGATPALDASLGNVFRLAAAGNRTIAVPSNAVSGQKIIIQHYASGGARTLALNSGAGGFRFGTDITALTATSSGKTDYIGCIYNATDTFWDVVAVTKGF